MNEERRTRLVEWGFRLLIFGLVALWVVFPSQFGTPAAQDMAKETREDPKATQHEHPQRLAPLATPPVFFRLDGKKVVLVGASARAFSKAELLAATGANLPCLH